MPPGLTRGVAFQIGGQQRARSHKAHLAPDDVPQLGELVQRGSPEAFAKRGQAVRIGQQGAVLVHGIGHGLEFEDAEQFAFFAGTFLTEENIFGNTGAHLPRHHGHDRQQQNAQGNGENKVEGAFDRTGKDCLRQHGLRTGVGKVHLPEQGAGGLAHVEPFLGVPAGGLRHGR